MKLEFSGQIFEKYSTNFMKVGPVGRNSSMQAAGRKDENDKVNGRCS